MSKPRGRPRQPDPLAVGVHVRMTPAQRLELHRVANENGMRLSTVVREAVDEFVGDYADRRPFRRLTK